MNPAPYTVYRLPDGLHVRTMSPAMMVKGEGVDRMVRVYPVDGAPSIEAEAWVSCEGLVKVMTADQWMKQQS